MAGVAGAGADLVAGALALELVGGGDRPAVRVHEVGVVVARRDLELALLVLGEGGANQHRGAAAAVGGPGAVVHRVEAVRDLGAEIEPAPADRGVEADRAEAAAAGPRR